MSILKRELLVVQGDTYIKFNDNQLYFDQDFRIYMFSMQSNPHFTPEVQQQASILNFAVTTEGLEQELLSLVCKKESAKEEEDREKIIR